MIPLLPAHLARECRTDPRGIMSQGATVFVPAPPASRRRVGDLIVVSVGSGTYHFRIPVAR